MPLISAIAKTKTLVRVVCRPAKANTLCSPGEQFPAPAKENDKPCYLWQFDQTQPLPFMSL